jgi:predicted transcriptional regulator
MMSGPMNAEVHPEARELLGSGNRESLEIINLILLVCLNGTMKTHIMYKCNLNSKQVQEYLELLLKYRLVEKLETDSRRVVYRTSERGKRFIKSYGELLEIFELMEEDQRS